MIFRKYTVNAILFGMKIIIAQFKPNNNKYYEANGYPSSQSCQINERANFIPRHRTNSSFEIGF
jgi:hypothetical protein